MGIVRRCDNNSNETLYKLTYYLLSPNPLIQREEKKRERGKKKKVKEEGGGGGPNTLKWHTSIQKKIVYLSTKLFWKDLTKKEKYRD